MVFQGHWPAVGTLMDGYDIVHVAVAPPNMLEESLVKRVAVIISKDLYGARLLLAGKIPRIVSHYQTIQEAESIAQSLRALDLVAIVCNDSELRKPSSATFRARTLKLGEREAIFWDKGSGEPKKVRAQDVFLVLKGTMQNRVEKEAIRDRMKFSLPATVLTGGIPIWRRVKEKTKDMAVQSEGFVRLYDRTSPEPSVEVFQHSFDYSFLGTKMASSSLANLRTTAMELKNTFPGAVFDDRLTEAFGIYMSSAAPGEEIEINSKLIYLCHKAASGLGTSA